MFSFQVIMLMQVTIQHSKHENIMCRILVCMQKKVSVYDDSNILLVVDFKKQKKAECHKSLAVNKGGKQLTQNIKKINKKKTTISKTTENKTKSLCSQQPITCTQYNVSHINRISYLVVACSIPVRFRWFVHQPG